jgi:iron complex outermembrane recepter protein
MKDSAPAQWPDNRIAHFEGGNIMSRKIMHSLFATTALAIALPTVAFAQEAPADSDEATVDNVEIIVEARRSAENVQDVPVSVQVVTGDKLQELAITSADELSKLAPGLKLENAGASTAIILRGVAWKPGSGTPATPLYFNEVPFDPGNTVVSLFDVGQIEVLRGPQGTSRGAPSISGAITLTTKKPDLNEFGGYVQGLYGSDNHWDVQGAINVPIIKDMLAIRLATNIENSENDRVNSIKTNVDPKLNDRSYRATVLFQPTETLSIQAMYQRRRTDKLRYDQVVGTGSPGRTTLTPTQTFLASLGALGVIPANFNGPALTVGQRASVQDGGNITKERINLLTINAEWEVFGHTLSANYGRQYNKSPSSFNSRDPLNMLPGFEPYAEVPNLGNKWESKEIRISSLPNENRPFDYDIGWFSKHSNGTAAQNLLQYLPGAFGAPNALPGAGTYNPAYTLPINLTFPIGQVFDSFYGNIRFHIGESTELSGGLAIVRDRVPVGSNTVVGAGRANAGPLAIIRLQFPGFLQPLVTSCEIANSFANQGLFTSTTYPGTCDVNVPAGSGNSSFTTNPKYSRALYNFSLSHKFTDDVMVYATTGSSYRSGLPSLGSVGLGAALLLPKPEGAKSYELGIKTTLSPGLRVNAAIFQIDYQDQLTQFEGIQYWNPTGTGRIDRTSLAFYRNVDSQVRGFEVEIAAQPTDNLSLGANISYSKIKSKGGLVPANPGDCAGTVPLNAANFAAGTQINFCPSAKGQVLNQSAPFQATFNGGYNMPLGPLDGYLRFNLNYQGKNPNFGNFPTAGVFRKVPSYAILDLFSGIAGKDGEWDVGFYAKNVFDKQVENSRVATLNNIYSPYQVAPGGYDVVRTSLPREIGVTARFSFGSR